MSSTTIVGGRATDFKHLWYQFTDQMRGNNIVGVIIRGIGSTTEDLMANNHTLGC